MLYNLSIYSIKKFYSSFTVPDKKDQGQPACLKVQKKYEERNE